MKKIIPVFTGFLVLGACISKKSQPTGSTEPTAVQLLAAKTRFPDATMETLNKGHSVYYGACTQCHGAKDIIRRTEQEWPAIVDRMATKAKLSQEEKDAVWKYVMSVKLSTLN